MLYVFTIHGNETEKAHVYVLLTTLNWAIAWNPSVSSFCGFHKVCEFSREDSEYKACGSVSTYEYAYDLNYR